MFSAAASAFAQLVRGIPDGAWDGPGLGEWDLRALVGHTSRSLITVTEYLAAPHEHEDITDAAGYYTYIRAASGAMDPAHIVERGVTAGRALGSDPAHTVDVLVAEALTAVTGADDPLITVIGGAGIRLSSYLPTRVFELVVHGFDISRATGAEFTPPRDVVAAATVLAAQIAAAFGDGPTVLAALTGRAGLPSGYSVV